MQTNIVRLLGNITDVHILREGKACKKEDESLYRVYEVAQKSQR